MVNGEMADTKNNELKNNRIYFHTIIKTIINLYKFICNFTIYIVPSNKLNLFENSL